MIDQKTKKPRRMRGFERTGGLLKEQVRAAGEGRGFAVSRLLTHWHEVVGEDIADMALPVKVGFGREGFGATLTLLTKGAYAPLLQASLPKIKDRVNACYGYAAISHVRITQTAPTGFEEGQVAFQPAPKEEQAQPTPEVTQSARQTASEVSDNDLRSALEALGKNVLSRRKG